MTVDNSNIPPDFDAQIEYGRKILEKKAAKKKKRIAIEARNNELYFLLIKL